MFVLGRQGRATILGSRGVRSCGPPPPVASRGHNQHTTTDH
ncbi:hypothetical protein [Mycobacterium phage Weirdo19]|uniref:Uncharacterized protein n=1 Tax=Mycobacterium phage Weirdo19 TaxID=2601610 RepID=A0A6M2YT14_9CAUD|nr:hypothetical protein KDJ11_gp72 [Mycobacterium phage Weirdo19]QEA10840.1 hypothetical protein [Mycobacterium phage Weirdo19]